NAGTLLAPAATIHLSRPWVPPARSGAPLTNGAPRFVPASLITAEIDALVTRFPLSHRAARPRAIVVRLDRIDAGARVEQVTVESEGGEIGGPQVVRSDARVDLIFPLRVPRDAASGAAISISAKTGRHWRLAGVIASTETPASCARALATRHRRLQAIAPREAAARTTGIVIERRRSR